MAVLLVGAAIFFVIDLIDYQESFNPFTITGM